MKRFFNTPIVILLVLMVIMNIINEDFSNPLEWLIDKLLLLPAIVIGLSLHEYAHGLVSNWLGDPTPKLQGRLTINPMAHMDPIGFIALIFAGFGWGIPVEIDPRYYKHRRRDEFLVAIAGVTMNFLIAVVFCFVLKYYLLWAGDFVATSVGHDIFIILQNVIAINVILLVFNLLPVPPLDGFGIITEIFNLRNTKLYYEVYDKGFAILMILLIFGIADKIISPCFMAIYNFLVNLIILG